MPQPSRVERRGDACYFVDIVLDAVGETGAAKRGRRQKFSERARVLAQIFVLLGERVAKCDARGCRRGLGERGFEGGHLVRVGRRAPQSAESVVRLVIVGRVCEYGFEAACGGVEPPGGERAGGRRIVRARIVRGHQRRAHGSAVRIGMQAKVRRQFGEPEQHLRTSTAIERGQSGARLAVASILDRRANASKRIARVRRAGGPVAGAASTLEPRVERDADGARPCDQVLVGHNSRARARCPCKPRCSGQWCPRH